jgi:hypothetical protein
MSKLQAQGNALGLEFGHFSSCCNPFNAAKRQRHVATGVSLWYSEIKKTSRECGDRTLMLTYTKSYYIRTSKIPV